MENDLKAIGTIQLTPQQHYLIDQHAEIILGGTVEQAVKSFVIIFERPPENDMELQIFQALCEQKIKERTGDFGIKGVIPGGEANGK